MTDSKSVEVSYPNFIEEMNSKFPVFTAGIYDPAGVGGFGNVTNCFIF